MVFFLMLRVSPLMPPTLFYANGFCSYANRAFPYANRAFSYAHRAFPYAPPPPRPFTSKTWLFLMLPCCTLHHNWLFLMPPPPPSFPPKSWAPPCQAARTSDDLRSHNRNPKCSSAALAHACFLRGYRFLPRAQATPVVHNLTPPVSVSSSEHPWPGHDDVRGRSGPDDVHGLVRSQFSASMVQP